LAPLFHELKIDEKWEQRLALKKENKNIGDLFNIKFGIYNYLNQNGKIIKTISISVNKEFIKQLEKKEYNGKFQINCLKAFCISNSISIASIIGLLHLRLYVHQLQLLY